MLYFLRQFKVRRGVAVAGSDVLGGVLWGVLVWGASLGVAQAQSAGAVQLNPVPTQQSSAPATAVPAVQYHSAFVDLPKGLEQTALDWKAANANVGQFTRGHADIVQWEAQQAAQQAAPTGSAMPCCKGVKP